MRPALRLTPTLRQSIRPRSLPLPLLTPLPTRYLHSTPPRLASDATTNDLLKASQEMLQKTGIYDKIMKNPGILELIREMGEVLQSKGIAMDPSNPPSKMSLIKLAFDSDVRNVLTRLTEEMKKAGIDADPETLKQLMGPLNDPSTKK